MEVSLPSSVVAMYIVVPNEIVTVSLDNLLGLGFPRYSSSQGADVTNRPVQNSKTACAILISFFNKRVFGAVWLSSSRVTRISCLISKKRIVRIRQNLVRSFFIDYFMGAHDGFTNETKRAEN